MAANRLIKKIDFAKLSGVGRPAITKAARTKTLAAAMVDDMVDIDHPLAQKYLREKGGTLDGYSPPVPKPKPEPKPPKVKKPPKPPKPPKPKKEPKPAKPPKVKKVKVEKPQPEQVPEEYYEPAAGNQSVADDFAYEPSSDEEVSRFGDMTLDTIVELYGTGDRFKTWLEARVKIEDIKIKQMKNKVLEGDLIPRDMVRSHVFGYLDSTNKRIIVDSPKSIARQVISLSRGGGSIEEAEKLIRGILTKQLKRAKGVVLGVLKEKI